MHYFKKYLKYKTKYSQLTGGADSNRSPGTDRGMDANRGVDENIRYFTYNGEIIPFDTNVTKMRKHKSDKQCRKITQKNGIEPANCEIMETRVASVPAGQQPRTVHVSSAQPGSPRVASVPAGQPLRSTQLSPVGLSSSATMSPRRRKSSSSALSVSFSDILDTSFVQSVAMDESHSDDGLDNVDMNTKRDAAIREIHTHFSISPVNADSSLTKLTGDTTVRRKDIPDDVKAELEQINIKLKDTELADAIKSLAHAMFRDASIDGVLSKTELRAYFASHSTGKLRILGGMSNKELSEYSKAPPMEQLRIIGEKFTWKTFFDTMDEQAQFDIDTFAVAVSDAYRASAV